MPKPLKPSRPLIGIICAPHYEKGALFWGLRSVYTQSVAMAGALPLMIAPDIGEQALREIYERLDGVLMAGGGDIDPAHYGMARDDLVHDVDPQRDAAEINLTQWAMADDKPLLGICRGCQVVNVALGGTLYRDIAREHPDRNGIRHDLWGKYPREYEAHSVTVQSGTRLAAALGIVGGGSLRVNTLHHQAVRQPAPNLVVSAIAEDGIIEGVELPNARFFVGVQWHPEEMVVRGSAHGAVMRRLFESFARAATGTASDPDSRG